MAAGIGLVALAQGAEGDLLAYYTAHFFGLRAFGAIFGVLGMILGVSVAAGGIAGGFMFDVLGNYNAVLIAGSALSLVAAAAVLSTGFVGPPARESRPAPSRS